MKENPVVKCPKCNQKCTKLISGGQANWIRGYGFLDKVGAKRDMQLHTLENNDPYAKIRPPGDKEQIADKLRKGGKHNPRPRYFT